MEFPGRRVVPPQIPQTVPPVRFQTVHTSPRCSSVEEELSAVNGQTGCKNETPGSGLRRSSQSVLGVPTHRGRARRAHNSIRRAFKIKDFTDAIRFFLVARRAPHIEDLGFSSSWVSSLGCGQFEVPDDCGYGHGLLAMQACHAAESGAFGFNCHHRASLILG